MKNRNGIGHQLGMFTALLAITLIALPRAQSASITWATGDGDWDTTSPNWTGDASTYTDGGVDTVLFEDSAGNPPATIAIQAGGVQPQSTTVNTDSSYEFTGAAITGAGSLTKSGSGTLTLTADNTYSGGTTISGGVLNVATNAKLGDASGALTFAGDSTLNFTQTSQWYNRTFAIEDGVTATFTGLRPLVNGKITGAGALVLDASSDSLIANADNDWTGGLTILSGTPRFYTGTFGDPTNIVTLAGGTIWSVAGLTVSNELVLAGGSINPRNTTITWDGKITGADLIIHTGNADSVLILTNPDNDFGNVIFRDTRQQLEVSSAANLGTGGIQRDTGTNGTTTLRITGANPGSFSQAVDVGTVGGAFQFDITDSDAVVDWDGVVSGTVTWVALDKTGPGRLNLNADNAFAGTMTVTEGTLAINGNSTGGNSFVTSDAALGGSGTLALNSGTSISIQDGGTLQGTLTVTGGNGVTVADGGIVSPGESTGTLTLGSLTLSDGSILNFDLTSPNVIGGGINDLIAVDGDLTLDGILNVTFLDDPVLMQPYTLLTYTGTLTGNGLAMGAGFPKTAYIDTSTLGQINLYLIPEPTSAILLGLAGLTLLRRRRQG